MIEYLICCGIVLAVIIATIPILNVREIKISHIFITLIAIIIAPVTISIVLYFFLVKFMITLLLTLDETVFRDKIIWKRKPKD